jgi:hypothetical protein
MVSVIGGAMLVLVGCALLIDRLGYPLTHRWLFLILLVPASIAIVDGLRMVRSAGWRSVQALSRLIAGILFALIGMLMFLRLDTVLPALIMALGIVTVARAFGRLP